jgi:hypothetical protein
MNRFALTVIAILASGLIPAAASDVTGVVSLDRLVQTSARSAPNFQLARGEHLVMASLPSQHVRTVKSETDTGGFHQIIAFDGGVPGLSANVIDIRYRRTVADSDVAMMQKPTESGIRDELAARFPNMEMIVVARPRSNAYGIYGLAVGKSASGASCIYAWQWADTSEAQPASDSFDALSLRITLCRTGVTLDALAADLDRLHVGPARMTIASGSKPPQRLAASRLSPAPKRVAKTPMKNSLAAIQNAPPPVMMAVESKLATIDPILDPSLPAAAYQGPTKQTQFQRVSQ